MRVLPAGPVTLAVRRSETLPLRLNSRRTALGSLSLTVLRALPLTLKDLVLNLTRRLRPPRETGLTVLPESRT